MNFVVWVGLWLDWHSCHRESCNTKSIKTFFVIKYTSSILSLPRIPVTSCGRIIFRIVKRVNSSIFQFFDPSFRKTLWLATIFRTNKLAIEQLYLRSLFLRCTRSALRSSVSLRTKPSHSGSPKNRNGIQAIQLTLEHRNNFLNVHYGRRTTELIIIWPSNWTWFYC